MARKTQKQRAIKMYMTFGVDRKTAAKLTERLIELAKALREKKKLIIQNS